jgi:K+-transporting ATPase KdpF subunit
MSASARNCEGRPMENLVMGMLAVLLFIYLLAAVIRPEKF